MPSVTWTTAALQQGKAVGIQFAALVNIIEPELKLSFLDQLQRFQLWASSLGLYKTGHSSIEYNFRDSPPLYEYALSLLQDLGQALTSLAEASTGDEASPDSDNSKDRSDDTDGSDEDEDFPSYQDSNLVEEYLGNISTTVDRLYALSYRIRDPAMRTGLSRAASYTEIDENTDIDLIASFTQWDRVHLVELFRLWWKQDSMEDHFLVRRLAQANTRRRQQFKYWAYCRDQLQNQDQAGLNNGFTRFPRPMGEGNHHASATDGELDRNLSSEHAFSPESDSGTSSDSLGGFEGGEEVALHFRPVSDHDSKEFQCPYCFIVCGRKALAREGWRKHVFRDLRPYVCTFEECKEPDQLYDSISDWMAHEFSSHDCHRDRRRACPFCLAKDVDNLHIASHQRRVAYFSLPRLRMDTTEATSRTQLSSNISKRASIAPDNSLASSVHDDWANNVKKINITIPAVGSMTASVFPNEEVETVLVQRLKEHFSYISSTEFRFTDSNDIPVPIDYDALYGSMTVFAHPSGSRGNNVAEQITHKDESVQEPLQSSSLKAEQVVTRDAQRTQSRQRSIRRESCAPATQGVAIQSPPAQQLPQPQVQPSSRIPARSTMQHVQPLDETPSDIYQLSRAEEPIGEELLIGGSGPQLQQISRVRPVYTPSYFGGRAPDAFSVLPRNEYYGDRHPINHGVHEPDSSYTHAPSHGVSHYSHYPSGLGLQSGSDYSQPFASYSSQQYVTLGPEPSEVLSARLPPISDDHPALVSNLDSRHIRQPRSYYTVGKIFAIVWHHDYGSGGGDYPTRVASRGSIVTSGFNQPIYTSIRRMVVFSTTRNKSLCFPISTYGGRGVSKPGVDPDKHAIVYPRGTQPIQGFNEPRMAKEPLEVVADSPEETMDPMSRLDFGKVYTVEHNFKVLPIGRVTSRSMTRFSQYTRDEMSNLA